MSPQEIAATGVVSFEDLKSLAAAKCPCITIATPIPNPTETRPRLKNAIRGVEKKLADQGADSNATSVLVEPIQAIAADADTEKKWANSLIVFRSPEIFRYYWLRDVLKEILVVSGRFQIRPVLFLPSRVQRFFILALSRQHTRLFRCTQHSSEEVELGGLAPQNMRVWLNNRQPDHLLENRSYAGPSVGSMKGVTFGSSTDRESEDEYLAHFLKEIDKGIHKVLRDDTAPLILMGVEYELALYRRVNSYQHLSETAIHGSPDHLAPRELHQQAMGIVTQLFSDPLKKALADFEEKQNNRLVSFSATEILRAAHAGRVADLFLSETAELRGTWNEELDLVQIQADADDAEDLLNTAAVETLLHGGQAFALRPQDMPGQAEVAASLRFRT